MKIHVIQAAHGDCLLLDSTTKSGRPTRILVDGGAEDTYRTHLRPRLVELPGWRILDAVVLTHVDNDHLDGLLDLTEELRKQRDLDKRPTVRIRDFWINQYEVELLADLAATVPNGAPSGVLMGLRAGADLTREIRALDIPMNAAFGGAELVAGEAEPLRLRDLRVTVVGPTRPRLEALRRDWEEWARGRREIPVEAMGAPDRSVPNLSSIMLLVEQGGRRALLCGDGRADDILEGLELAGLLPEQGTMEVDLLKLPHHGSARNCTPELFRRVAARTYVISADGTYGNPDEESLRALAEGLVGRSRPVDVVLTNRTEAVDSVIRSHPPDRYGYRLRLLEPGRHVLTIPIA